MSLQHPPELAEGEQLLTIQEAHRSIGERAYKLPSRQPVIICRVANLAILVRGAGDRGRQGADSSYGWSGPESLIVRASERGRVNGGHRLPNWLEAAVAASKAAKRVDKDLAPVVAVVLIGPEIMTPADVVDELAYRSYRQQRLLSADRPIASWKVIYGADVERFEEKFSEERELEGELDARVRQDAERRK